MIIAIVYCIGFLATPRALRCLCESYGQPWVPDATVWLYALLWPVVVAVLALTGWCVFVCGILDGFGFPMQSLYDLLRDPGKCAGADEQPKVMP